MSSSNDKGVRGYLNMMQSCNLIDARFQSSPFTWRRDNLFQRLDRVLLNINLEIVVFESRGLTSSFL